MRALSLLTVTAALTFSVASIGLADDGFTTIDFPTAGGLSIRADLYGPKRSDSTLVLLFHQAGWSRGEYREIAPKLVSAGYRVMAVDQRSGRGVNGVPNETHQRAAKRKLGTSYLDAYPDLDAALTHAREALGAKRVVVWGSSYSASLVIRLAAERPKDVSAVVAFSPGEYFQREEGAAYVRTAAAGVKQPLFITSSKKERAQVKPIFDASPGKKKVLFTPASKGQHGSRALWTRWPDHDVYWGAINGFLDEYAAP